MSACRKCYAGILLLVVMLASGACTLISQEDVPQVAPLQATLTSTPALTETAISTVTPAAIPVQEEFTLATINTFPPDDVIAETYFFIGGGELSPMPAVCDPSPAPFQPDRHLMEPLYLLICWPRDFVTISVFLPDGRVDVVRLESQNGGLQVQYQPFYDYPAGTYLVRLDGTKTEMEFRVNFTETNAPRVLEVPPQPFSPVYWPTGPHRSLIVENFIPGEKVRLFAYLCEDLDHPDIHMVGWQEFTIPESGGMPVTINLTGVEEDDILVFVAIGELTGEVHYRVPTGDMFLQNVIGGDLYCASAKPSRLNINSTARVAFIEGRKLLIFQEPDFSSAIIAQAPEGGLLDIVDGPECTDHSRFWQVAYEGMYGWVAEADQTGYLIEPVE